MTEEPDRPTSGGTDPEPEYPIFDEEEGSSIDGNPESESAQPGGDDAQNSPGDGRRSTAAIGEAFGDFHIAENLTSNLAYHYTANYGKEAQPELTLDDFDHFTAEQLDAYLEIPVVEETQVLGVVERIHRHRITVLVGDRRLGKGVCALTAGIQLDRGEDRVGQILLASSPTRDARVRIESLLAEEQGPERRLLVLENAFDQGNRDLVRLIERLDEASLSSLSQQLQEHESYLVLTTERERLPIRTGRLAQLGVIAHLARPPAEFLLQALHRRALGLEQASGNGDDERRSELEKLLEENGERITAALGTVPRIIDFVDSHMSRVLTGEWTLDEALERVDGLEHWLLHELPEGDSDAWAFVLALTLASGSPRTGWIPWLPFQRLWDEVAEALHGALGREDGECHRSPAQLVVDRHFLSRVRATVRQLSFPAGEAVRFRDPDYPTRLWRVLHGPGRRILGILANHLLRLVEDDEPVMRELATEALGRAAPLAPRSLFFPQMAQWTRSQENHHHEALADLVTGALGSDDAQFRAGCIHRLRQAVHDDTPRVARAGIVALGRLGMIDLELAMVELQQVVERRVGDHIQDVGSLNARLRAAEAAVRKELGGDPDAYEMLHRDLLRDLAGELFDETQSTVLVWTQYALVGLCFGRDPLQVFRHLSGWMRDGLPGTAPLVSLLSLRQPGILDILERHPMAVPLVGSSGKSENGRSHRYDRTLLALRSEDDVLDLSGFVESLFEGTTPFPALFRNWLRDQLRESLDAWVKAAARQAAVRDPSVLLFAALLDASDAELRELVFNLLQRARSLHDDDPEVSSLAAKALEAMPPRRSR